MNEFKIGDRVRVTSNSWLPVYGKLGIIKDIDKDSSWPYSVYYDIPINKNEGVRGIYRADELELEVNFDDIDIFDYD